MLKASLCTCLPDSPQLFDEIFVMNALPPSECLPHDAEYALLIGRVWRGGDHAGPSVVVVRNGQVFDITAITPTVADLLDRPDVTAIVGSSAGEPIGDIEPILLQSQASHQSVQPLPDTLLAPCDTQAVKACGVTFAVSLLERLIEEQAGGDPVKAHEIRAHFTTFLGKNFSHIRPGSDAAARLKQDLLERGSWSQYMEVGLGPDAEVFTKSQPMSSVGFGAAVGLSPASQWNNPEPEIVLAVNSRGVPMGATLGNDVNLRDIEGRSALLLGKAKDNNGSCAIGPFIRLFDDRFTMDTLRHASVSVQIEGERDGFLLSGVSNMAEISRDPLDLVSQVYGDHHQYPDGFMLFLGTMFSPTQDRHVKGEGFTHELGDRVLISTPSLGTLINTVQLSTQIPRWEFGVRALFRSLFARNLQ